MMIKTRSWILITLVLLIILSFSGPINVSADRAARGEGLDALESRLKSMQADIESLGKSADGDKKREESSQGDLKPSKDEVTKKESESDSNIENIKRSLAEEAQKNLRDLEASCAESKRELQKSCSDDIDGLRKTLDSASDSSKQFQSCSDALTASENAVEKCMKESKTASEKLNSLQSDLDAKRAEINSLKTELDEAKKAFENGKASRKSGEADFDSIPIFEITKFKINKGWNQVRDQSAQLLSFTRERSNHYFSSMVNHAEHQYSVWKPRVQDAVSQTKEFSRNTYNRIVTRSDEIYHEMKPKVQAHVEKTHEVLSKYATQAYQGVGPAVEKARSSLQPHWENVKEKMKPLSAKMAPYTTVAETHLWNAYTAIKSKIAGKDEIKKSNSFADEVQRLHEYITSFPWEEKLEVAKGRFSKLRESTIDHIEKVEPLRPYAGRLFDYSAMLLGIFCLVRILPMLFRLLKSIISMIFGVLSCRCCRGRRKAPAVKAASKAPASPAKAPSPKSPSRSPKSSTKKK